MCRQGGDGRAFLFRSGDIGICGQHVRPIVGSATKVGSILLAIDSDGLCAATLVGVLVVTHNLRGSGRDTAHIIVRDTIRTGVSGTQVVIGCALSPTDVAQQRLDYRGTHCVGMLGGRALAADLHIAFVELHPSAQVFRHVVITESAMGGIAQDGRRSVITRDNDKAIAVSAVKHIIWSRRGRDAAPYPMPLRCGLLPLCRLAEACRDHLGPLPVDGCRPCRSTCQ